MPSNLDQVILKKITQPTDCYIIFYSNWCKYSLNALSLLRSRNACYKGYEIESIPGGMDYLLKLFNSTSELNFNPMHKTRPMIFYNGKFIGGYSELLNYGSSSSSYRA